MTDEKRDRIMTALNKVFWISVAVAVIAISYNLGKVVGFTKAYEVQLEEKIRLLEQSRQELIKQSIERYVNDD